MTTAAYGATNSPNTLLATRTNSRSRRSTLPDRLTERRDQAPPMVATIQLFGGSLNLNPHAHLLVLDGVYHNDGHQAVFTETRAPTQSEIAEVTRRVQARVLRELERRGLLRDPNDARNEAESEPMIGCAQLSLRLGKLGRVDEHGRVQPDDMDLDARFARPGKLWCADIDGYRLQAGVTVRGADDVGRENRLLRHPISLSRLNRSGRRLALLALLAGVHGGPRARPMLASGARIEPHERRAGRLPDEVPKGKQDTSADGARAVFCAPRESGPPTASSVGSVRGRAIERIAMA